MGQLQYMWAGASLANPDGVMKDFFKGLAIATMKPIAQLQVGKNFTGTRVGRQALNMNGATTIKFSLLANGDKKFPQDEHGMVLMIRVLTGVNATVNATDWAPGIADANLNNATMTVVNNGDTIFKDLPLDIFPQSAEQNDSGIYCLVSPFYWLAQTQIEITINLPVAVVAVNTNMAIELIGPGLTS